MDPPGSEPADRIRFGPHLFLHTKVRQSRAPGAALRSRSVRNLGHGLARNSETRRTFRDLSKAAKFEATKNRDAGGRWLCLRGYGSGTLARSLPNRRLGSTYPPFHRQARASLSKVRF